MTTTPLVEAVGLQAGYAGHPVVRDVDLAVHPGEVVTLLGANGAGKTTTLLTLAGYLKPVGGVLRVDGEESQAPLSTRARKGMAFVTEDKSVFFQLTVRENLRVGGVTPGSVTELFPELHPLLDRKAGLLSGGEQQMLSVGRALARRPRLLLLDELSLGLAPLIVARLLRAVRDAADGGVGVLLVEQHVEQALDVADRALVLQRGTVVLSGTADEVRDRRDLLEDSYLMA